MCVATHMLKTLLYCIEQMEDIPDYKYEQFSSLPEV
jgi:hypothetical protein